MAQEPSAQDIQELRTQFLKKLDEEGSSIPGGIHPADLARIKSSDEWLRRFLLHNELDLKESLTMAWDTCKWRKSFGTNDITEKNVRTDYLEDGSMFGHSSDKDGKTLFILKCKKHVKGQRDLDELKRCVVYWFERLERQDKGEMITLFFDMSDTGLSNMDMDYIKYLISLFKQYYPWYLNYIIIFEMPWVLNAAFKIIKSWLPEKAVQKIKFVNKGSLKEFVDADHALTCWGGRDDYVFSFVPEDRCKTERKVHFADNQGDSSPSSSEMKPTDNQASKLKITPSSEYITFISDGNEMSASLTVANSDDLIISYKIKTTSPEKYRVRPSSGILKPGASVSVSVMLHAGFQQTGLSRDKFLIMGFPVESADMSTQEITELWKRTGNNAVELHRLRCSIGGGGGDSITRNGGVGASFAAPADSQLTTLHKKVSSLLESSVKIESELRLARRVQCSLLLLLLTFGVILGYVAFMVHESNSKEQSCYSHPHEEL